MEAIELGNDGTAAEPSRLIWPGLWRELDALNDARAAKGSDAMPLRVVVLLPFAQLRTEAAAAWRAHSAGRVAFAPRFETTRSWAQARADAIGFRPRAGSLGTSHSLDWLEAWSRLNAQVPSHAQALLPRLLELSGALGAVAAARAPQSRSDWLAACLSTLGLSASPNLSAERIALREGLRWAAQSQYISDVLWDADALAGVDAIVHVAGLQDDAWLENWRSFAQSGGVLWRDWDAVAAALDQPRAAVYLSDCANPSDEVMRCAAAVGALRAWSATAQQPIALVAQDRGLVRRIVAELAAAGVLVRDETGWLLSTSRAAHWVLGALACARDDARTLSVIDWARDAQATDGTSLDELTMTAGAHRWALWRAALAAGSDTAASIERLLAPLRKATTRDDLPLSEWLACLHATLQAAPAYAQWAADVAYQSMAMVLGFTEPKTSAQRLNLDSFTRWVSHTLESATFTPIDTPIEQAQVVVLPPEQLLGRQFGAVVFGGASEPSMSISPGLALLTEAQIAALGLPSFEARVAQLARTCAVAEHTADRLWVLWHQQERGEDIAPSIWVQQLRTRDHELAPDVCTQRTVLPVPQTPDASAIPEALLPKIWSATAYAALRACPYQFFALQSLRLRAPEDPERDADPRDWGNLIHDALSRFHARYTSANQWRELPPDQLRDALDACCQAAQSALNLPLADALAYAAAWPRVRDRYLAWLQSDTALAVAERELSLERTESVGQWRGRIDRVDELPGGLWRVVDYKTSASSKTAERAREPLEDIQIAWYAALWSARRGSNALSRTCGGYLAIPEGRDDRVELAEVEDLPAITEQLQSGWAEDVAALTAGVVLPPIGAQRTCDRCDARGLCRRDFWPQVA